MSDLDVIVGLAARAATITGLRTDPLSGFIPGAIEVPFFGVNEVTDESYHQVFGAGAMIEALFTCAIFVSRGDASRGAADLSLYTSRDGPKSVMAALEADQTLGGAAKALVVEKAHGKFRTYTVGGVDYLGSMLDVRVWY